MKPKILYITFALFISVILISIWISRESIKIQGPLEEAKTQQMVPDYTQQFPSTFGNRPAITRIKPEPKKPSLLPGQKPIPAIGEAMDESRQAARTAPSQSTSLARIESESDDFSDEPPTPGITKIGKYPTEKEKQEMDARGIIMY
jgi:hypothetical protein